MYYPTFDITDEMLEDLRTGKVSIQTGQWVRLPMSNRKARWIGVSPGEVIVVQHYEGSYSKGKFAALVDHHKGAVKAERVRAILDSLGFVLLAGMVLLGCAPKRVDTPAVTDYGCTVDSIDAGWASVETPGGMAATPSNPHWVEGQSVPCPE